MLSCFKLISCLGIMETAATAMATKQLTVLTKSNRSIPPARFTGNTVSLMILGVFAKLSTGHPGEASNRLEPE